tara:strand:- start:4914 stop:5387 length:474 start_codon:yes stop_codon:yes gene_type:complete
MISYIYKITLQTGEVYIGSTIRTLKNRLNAHKNSGYLGKNYDLNNCKIEALESFYYDYDETDFHRKFLRKREQYYIDNNECINVIKAYQSLENKQKEAREKTEKWRLNNYDTYIKKKNKRNNNYLNTKVCCRFCRIETSAHNFNYHTKTKKHLSNIK